MLNKEIKEKVLRNIVKYTAKIYYKTIYGRSKGLSYIPASGKQLGEEELLNMIDASLDMWLTSGRFNDEFEKELAKYLKVNYCLTVNSGSSANLLAISALKSYKLGSRQVKKGDEVITVAAGFPTTINPIIQNGLVPVFVDVEIGTYNIDIDQIERSITKKTKVIMIAHSLGNAFEIGKIKEICNRNNLWLIEDSCDALGCKYKGEYTGTIGDIGTFSFYPAHHITMGEGGAVVTNNGQLNKIIMSLRDWGRDCYCLPGKDNTCNCRFEQKLGNLPFGYDHKYTYSHLGYNLKITDWQASIGLAQLSKIEHFVNKRRENFRYLYDNLKKYGEYFILPRSDENVEPSWFGFLISVKDTAPFSKFDIVKYLEENNIGTRQLFSGNILRQPSFVNSEIALRILDSDLLVSSNLGEEDYKLLPNTEFIMNNTFWIGVQPQLSSIELGRVIKVFDNFLKKYK